MVKSQEIVPVIFSIAIIIAVAVLEKQSRLVAAITAVMPLNAPLALWIVYSSANGDRAATAQFSLGMLVGVVPTVGFLAAVWLAARAGMKLVPMILVGYVAWIGGLVVLAGVRHFWGF
jgi:hypothetical protein